MKTNFLFCSIFYFLVLGNCSKKETPAKTEEPSRNQESKFYSDEEMDSLKDIDIINKTEPPKKNQRLKPIDFISESSKLRQIEYKVSLQIQVKNALETREKFLNMLKPNSILKSSNTSFTGKENYTVEILTPISKLYETLVEVSKLGKIESESIYTEDLTEFFEEQKIKFERESYRNKRRNSAANEGSAQVKTWKEREDLLSQSEDGMDRAKLETWKIKDRISFAKISISFEGKELNDKFEIPNFYNAFVASVNFLLNIIYGIVYVTILLLVVFILYKGYKFFRK